MESVPPAAGCARPPPSVASAEGRGLRKLHVSQFNLKLQPHMPWITCTCRLKCYLVKVYLILLFLAGEVSSQERFPPRGTSGLVLLRAPKCLTHSSILVPTHYKFWCVHMIHTNTQPVLLSRSEPPGGHLGLQARLRSIPLYSIIDVDQSKMATDTLK